MGLKQIEKEKLKQQMLKAAKDFLFIEDLESSIKDFKSSDIKNWLEIPEW